MHVTNFKAQHVMGLKDIEFGMEGRHLVLVGGKNGQGKTSTLMSFLMALCGRQAISNWPEIALATGEEKGFIKIDLSGETTLHDNEGFSVELGFRRKVNGVVEESFRVLDSTGEEAAEPRTLLRSLYNLKAFDPLAFDRMSPKEQINLLLEMTGVNVEDYNRKRDELFEERTLVGREGRKLASRAEAMPKHEGIEHVCVDELLEEQDKITVANDAIKSANDDVNTLNGLIEGHNKNIEAYLKDIEEANRLLELAKEHKERDQKKLHECVDTLAEAKASSEGLRELSEVRKLIKEAGENNEKALANKQKAEAEAEAEEVRGKYAKLSKQIAKIDADKKEALAKANMPVKSHEVTITEDCILLDGLPWGQQNKSLRVVASTEIGMALNPTLKLLVCEDGSDLDQDTIEALDKLLAEHDFQAIVEIVTRTSEDEKMCAVVIEDGALKELVSG